MSQSNPPPAANSRPSPLRGTALTLGLIGAAFALIATGMVVWGSSDLATPAVGVLVRVGAILLAVSLILPSVKKPSIATLLLAGTGLVLVMMRPALIWAGLAGWLLWVTLGRQRSKTDRNDS